MRTTITLDPDVSTLIDKFMRARGISFKEAVNEALRTALAPIDESTPFDGPVFSMGGARVDLTHASSLAGELEDDELLRKAELAK